ncbi:MAG: hypothetical protein AAGF79_21460 [Pseudomonadota bacterium]
MNQTTTQGVDALIARLKDDGVSAGRAEAERLVSEARAEAAQILAKARTEADGALDQARKSSDAYRAAGEQALTTAMRDAVLRMKSGLEGQLKEQMQRLVSGHLSDEALLKQMILEVAGQVRPATQAGGAEVILPPAVLGPDEIREQAGDISAGQLTRYVLGLTGDMLREGVTLYAGEEDQTGIKVRVQDGEVEIDLTSEAIAALLLEHMQPRFRAVLEGVIRS